MNTADHSIDLLKHAFPDSEILKNCYLKRTKMKETIGKIAEFEKKLTVEQLKKTSSL